MILVIIKLLVNSRLLGVTFLEVKSYTWTFYCARRLCSYPPALTLFQDQLYFHFEAKSMDRLNIVESMKEEHIIWETSKQINEHLEALR